MSKSEDFSESPCLEGTTIVKDRPTSVSFKEPIELVKIFSRDDPPIKIGCDKNVSCDDIELNFTSVCGLLKDETSEFSNTLPYVKLMLGDKQSSLKTVGLLDTGCSWSICEYKTFTKIVSIYRRFTNFICLLIY